MPEAGEEGWIYTVPPGRWEERGAGGAQTGEFINVAPRCQLGAGGGGGGAAGASMPPLFDGASGRAASDGRCAPALPAALDHFHAKPRPRHPPSCGPRAGGEGGGGTAGGWERTGRLRGAGAPGPAWETRRGLQRRAAGRERPGGHCEPGGTHAYEAGGRCACGGVPFSVSAQPWLNGPPGAGAPHPRAEHRLAPATPLTVPPQHAVSTPRPFLARGAGGDARPGG